MENKDIQQQLDEIKNQLAFITEVLSDYKRKQREMDELKEDLTRISKDVLEVATVELEDVAGHFEPSDLVFLLKKIMRNIRNITKMFEQMESAVDFVNDIKPVTHQMFNSLLESLDEFERKGYFDFARESFKILDTIVTSFTVEDVVKLRENIVFMLETVKSMTQPEMLHTMNNALNFYKNMDVELPQNVSLGMLFKELKSPETRRAMVVAIHFLKNFATTTQNEPTQK